MGGLDELAISNRLEFGPPHQATRLVAVHPDALRRQVADAVFNTVTSMPALLLMPKRCRRWSLGHFQMSGPGLNRNHL